MKSCSQITADINKGISKLRESAPDALTGFGALAKGAMKAGSLSELNKELIALAIGVVGRWDGCIGFHAKTWCAPAPAGNKRWRRSRSRCTWAGGRR